MPKRTRDWKIVRFFSQLFHNVMLRFATLAIVGAIGALGWLDYAIELLRSLIFLLLGLASVGLVV